MNGAYPDGKERGGNLGREAGRKASTGDMRIICMASSKIVIHQMYDWLPPRQKCCHTEQIDSKRLLI